MALAGPDSQGGPKPLTQTDIEKTAAELKKLAEQRDKLRMEYNTHTEARDAELKEHKRIAADNRKQAEEIKSSGAARLAEQERAHETSRREDLAKISDYMKHIADGEKRIISLQQEVAALKAAALKPEELSSFLERLGLGSYLSLMQEEELDVELLRSMGRHDLASNMVQLGLSIAEAARMTDALFPADP